MVESSTKRAVADAVSWQLGKGLSFKESAYSAIHVPFSFTPNSISKSRFSTLKKNNTFDG